MEFNNKQKKFLKAEAHHLKPVMNIGKEGVTEPFLKELDQQLDIHELLKVKVLNNCMEDWEAMVPKFQSIGTHVIQRIGHVGILFRQRKNDSNFRL